MIVYPGQVDDVHALIQFFRREAAGLRILRKAVIDRQRTVVLDVNGDGIEFPALTYGCAALDALLRELGVAFTPATLHDPDATPDGVKEYRLSARHTWGHDRVM
jgi:hypothetical protein